MKKALTITIAALALILSACSSEPEEVTTEDPEVTTTVRDVLEQALPLLIVGDPAICEIATNDFIKTYTYGSFNTCDEYIASMSESGIEVDDFRITDMNISDGDIVDEKTLRYEVELATNSSILMMAPFMLNVSGVEDKWMLSDFEWRDDHDHDHDDEDNPHNQP